MVRRCLVPAAADNGPSRSRLAKAGAAVALAMHMVGGTAATATQNEGTAIRAGHTLRALTYRDLLEITDLGTGIPDQGDFDGLAVSPDGKWVAVETSTPNLESDTVSIRWKAISLHSSTIADLGDGGDPIPYYSSPGIQNGNSLPQRPVWSQDSQWIFYRARHDDETQLWRSSVDGKVQEQLTRNSGDVLTYLLSSNGSKLLYSVGLNRAELREQLREEARLGFLYDERFYPAHSMTPIIDSEGSGLVVRSANVWAFDPIRLITRPANDEERAEYERESVQSVKYHALYNLKTHPVLRDRPHARWIRRSAHSGTIAWLDDMRTNPGRGLRPPLTLVATRDPTNARLVKCPAAECTGYFKGLWLTDDGSTALFMRWIGKRDYGSLGLFKWRIGQNRVAKVFETTDLIENCAYVLSRLICSHESPTRPKTLVTLDLKSGAMETLYDPNPHFENIAFGSVAPLNWTTKGGIDGFGHLVMPINYTPGKRYPLVVVQYRSRGFLRGGVGDEYPIHLFASSGFAVLSFHRPDDWELLESGGDYYDVVRKQFNELSDRKRVLSVLLAGLDTIERMGIADGSRVGITGLSDGANTVAFAITHAPERFQAAAASNIAYEPILYYVGGPMVQREIKNWGFDYPENPTPSKLWKALSIALNAAAVRTPLLLQVSDSELLTTTQAFTALRESRKPAEMFVFPNEFHVKASPSHRFNIYRRNVQWFQFWLNDLEVGDPVDPQQYQRWRLLRAETFTNSNPLKSTVVTSGRH